MTEEEKELITSGADAAMKPFANLVERLFGGAVDQIGGGWEDRLKVRRQIRGIKLFRELKKAIDESQFDPAEIPDRIGIPALQEALLTDDDYLRIRWANLLANAADPRHMIRIEPLFVRILSEVSAREVLFLEVLPQPKGQQLTYNEGELRDVYIRAGLGGPEDTPMADPQFYIGQRQPNGFQLLIDVLARQQVIVLKREPEQLDSRKIKELSTSLYDTMPVTFGGREYYELTDLGAAFIRACQKPPR